MSRAGERSAGAIAAVHQLVSSFVPRDAVSAHALEVRDLLRAMGLESEIYVKETRGEARRHARFYRELEDDGERPPSVLLYQAATGSAIADFLLGRPEPKLVNYHNLTPSRFFAAWEPHTAVELDVGLRQMSDLAAVARLAIGVSEFNASALRELGFRHTVLAPLLLDLTQFDRRIDEQALAELERRKAGGGADLLFVGRLAPNKAQHDLVKGFAALRRLYDPRARLHLVGAPSSPRYQRALRGFVAELGLEDAVSLPGSVTDGELAAHYRAADVFVCASEHEGFCVPVVEAMYHGVPVVAFAAGAVPETLAGAGLLLPQKDAVTLAAAAWRALDDGPLRARLVEAAHRRVAELDLERSRARFRAVLESALETATEPEAGSVDGVADGVAVGGAVGGRGREAPGKGTAR